MKIYKIKKMFMSLIKQFIKRLLHYQQEKFVPVIKGYCDIWVYFDGIPSVY